MSITVSGLGSGLDYDSWITELVAIKQADIDKVNSQASVIKNKESTLSTIESDYKELLSAVQAFTDALSSEDVFNQKTATSSSDAVSATVTSSASPQSVSVSVSKLATATVAQSSSAVASSVGSSTTLGSISGGTFKAGTFSIYVNGQKNTLTLSSDMTMDDVLNNINGNAGEGIAGIDGVTATLSNGKLTISADSGNTVSVGSSSDTSNFSNIMSLTKNQSTGEYSSSKTIFSTNTSSALTSASFANGTVTAGTFTIGTTKFTIDSSTTLDGLIKKINNSDAGATASWDANAGKLVLTATEEGAVSINVTAGDGTVGDTDASNFTDIMGLTSSTWEDGNLASTSLVTSSQNLGANAILTINGTQITSSSNTVTSDVTGIKGLTLTLNSETTSTATVSVAQDVSKVTTALTNLVSAYNKSISATDDATTTDGNLYGETVLKSLRNKVRTLITSSINGGEGGYNSLADIGITTGAYSTNTKADTTQLKLDTDKLAKALSDNADAVKNLLVGSSSSSSDGVLDKLETVLQNATNSVKGYFTTREKSYDKQIDRLDDKASNMTEKLEKYKKSLEAKFSAMDQLISSFQKQASIFDSYFNKSSSSSSSSS